MSLVLAIDRREHRSPHQRKHFVGHSIPTLKRSLKLGFVPQLSSWRLSIDLVPSIEILSQDNHARDFV
jgi:hypothetical protein